MCVSDDVLSVIHAVEDTYMFCYLSLLRVIPLESLACNVEPDEVKKLNKG